jgi:hypothetical protein
VALRMHVCALEALHMNLHIKIQSKYKTLDIVIFGELDHFLSIKSWPSQILQCKVKLQKFE